MERSAEGTKNVTAIELGDWEKIEGSGEESDPSGAANGVKQQGAGRDAWMKNGSEKSKQERRTKDQVHVLQVGEARDGFGVQNAISEGWDGEDKADKRSGSTYIEQRSRGTNGRTNQDESAEGAHKRGERHKERIAGADVVMAASEVMTEFVCEKDGQERESERQSSEERGRVFVKERKIVDEFVEGDRLVLGVGNGKLSSSDKASAKREKKQGASEEERLGGRWRWRGRRVS